MIESRQTTRLHYIARLVSVGTAGVQGLLSANEDLLGLFMIADTTDTLQ